MPENGRSATLEEVVSLAKQLSPIDKVRLIERVVPDIERELRTGRQGTRVSLLGLLRHRGPAPSADEIDAIRQEAWASFPRADL
jgi:hypothetical protein